MANLYERLSALCEKQGIKGAQMCRELGFSKSLMTDLKSGRKKSVNAESAQKIASYFDVSVGYLLGQEEEQKEKSTVQDDGLSEGKRELIDKIMKLTEDQVQFLLQVAERIQ